MPPFFFLQKKLPLLKAIVWETCKRFWKKNKSKKDKASHLSDMAPWPSLFDVFLFLLSSFRRSKFHFNVIIGSGVITIFVYKGMTRNSEIGNTPVCVLPNIWRLGRVRDTTLCTNFFNKMLLDAAKCQSISFYRLWFIKGKPAGE